MGEKTENKKPQPAIEHTPPHQPIEKIEGVIYDTELKNMKNNSDFFQTFEYQEHGWMQNEYPIKIIGGTEVQIKDNIINITPGIQKVLIDSSYKTAESMNDMDKVVSRDMLQKTDVYNRKPAKRRTSGHDKSVRNHLDNEVRRTWKLDSKLDVRGIKKVIIPSNIIDIYTRLEILLGLKLLGHTDTVTEASNLIDELSKRGEIQNEQQCRNALDKFQT